MQKSQEELRNEFYYETDVEINEKSCCWKHYALWLEQQCAERINSEIIAENKKLKEQQDKIMELLEY